MISFSLNWKLILVAASIVAPLTAYPTWKLTSWHYKRELTSQKTTLLEEKKQAIANERQVCADNQAITERTSNDLQEALANSNMRVVSLTDRLHKAGRAGACVPVTGDTGRRDGAANGDMSALQGGVVAGQLVDSAAACDRQTAQLVACQAFLKETWAKHQHKP